ncbi:MAG TPA: YdcF family protein [Termitinemataceae bacterium]|nr:YdcF family protein [Termitinemataceae bacterium]HOM24464.1 YdcF family protein [Termitinemataceae bacterium]HPQ01595.1 YdcF family protein [Termitinemataceae bacterium]
MGTLVFYISKILRPLVTSPLAIGLVLSFWAILLLQPRNQFQRWLKGISLSVLILVTLLSLPMVTRLLSRLYETPLSQIEDVMAGAPYTAILVLGGTVEPAASRPGLVEGNDTFERLSAAARLYRAGAAPVIIASGGSGSITFPDKKEAPYMAEILELMGVPKSAIITEAASRNTHENIVYSKKILEGLADGGQHSAQPVLLVSSAWHLPRALAICKKAKLPAIPFSVDSQAEPLLLPADLFPDAWALTRSTRLIREWLGLIAYRLLGRL